MWWRSWTSGTRSLRGGPKRSSATQPSSRPTWDKPMLLELDDVHVHYGKIAALKGISLSVDRGEVVTLIGANGAGKTTTLKTISGLRHVSSGRITFDGRDITRLPGHTRAELGLVQAPEGRGIFP